MTRHFLRGRCVLVVMAMLGGVVAAAGAATAAPSGTRVTGTARGQAVEITTLPATQVNLAVAQSRMDSGGIGGGTNVASGTARPAHVVSGSIVLLDAADSATSGPPDRTATDGVPSVSLPAGLLTADSLSSGSSADAPPPDLSSPRSTNDAFINKATVLKPVLGPAVLDASTISGSSEARRAGPSGAEALSTGAAQIETLAVSILGVTIAIKSVTANATARATGVAPSQPGGSQGQVTECKVAEIKINATTLANVRCQGQQLSPLPALVSIKVGSPSTAASTLAASAKIDVLTITAPLVPGLKVVLGAVDVAAGVAAVAPPSDCAYPARPTARGSASGDVVQVTNSVPGAQVDALLAKAAIDEVGVAGSPNGATADGIAAQVQQSTVPLLVEAGDVHAAAPPPSAHHLTVASVGVAPFVATSAVVTDASASAAPDRSSPQGAASATADFASAAIGPVVGLGATTAASDASSKRNPTNVTSAGHASVESLTGSVAGLPLSLQAAKSSAVAVATGVAGGASASNTYQVAHLQIGSLVVDVQPPSGTVFNIPSVGTPLVRVTFGALTATTTPDGVSAAASSDAVVIEVLPEAGGLAQKIVIGHSDAKVELPAGAAAGPRASLSKDVDIQFDPTDSYGDSGATIHHGQKFKVRFCYANTGTVPLNQVVLTDPLDTQLRVPAASAFPLPPNVTLSAGNVLTTAPFNLGPGQTGSLVVVLETRDDTPPGLTVTNSATLTAGGLPGPVASNSITLLTGVVSSQPAVGSTLLSLSFDSGTGILTLNESLANAAGASTAIGARIESVTPLLPAVPQDTFPILLGDVAPGTSASFTLHLFIPLGQRQFSIDILESASSPDGHRYVFD